MPKLPILIFDVNKTLLDLDSLAPHFERLFGDRRVLREWFAQLILYSEALTLGNSYANFGALGGAVLRMLGNLYGRPISDGDALAIKEGVASMPAHPEVQVALHSLHAAGYRMFTLTNNPAATALAQLERAQLRQYFEGIYSIDQVVRQFKPAPAAYHWVANQLEVPTSECYLIACHVWDTIGAAGAGMRTALILRSGNSPLDVGPQPNVIGRDLIDVAGKIIAHGST